MRETGCIEDWPAAIKCLGGEEHGIFETGFLLMVGPLEGGRDTLWLVEAESAVSVRARAAEDPWASNGMLTPVTGERWDIVMDALSPRR